MPKTSNKTLSFPTAGVSRRSASRFQSRPYTSPAAYNVRGVDSLDERERGGSRPGIVKVSSTAIGDPISKIVPITYLDGSGDRQHDLIVFAGGSMYVLQGAEAASVDPTLLSESGVVIVTDDGTDIVFESAVTEVPGVSGGYFDCTERFGLVYMADSVLKVYNPVTGIVETVVASSGAVPTACPRMALYRDRLFLGGVDNVWYCSRQGDPTDWNFGADMGDVGRAVASQVGDAATIGGVITAFVPWEDSSIIMATSNELWLLQGDPTTGSLQQVSDSVGIICSSAWAISPDGMIAFLSNDGLYLMQAGGRSAPSRFSAERMPKELINIDPTSQSVSMEYDAEDRGFHLFITPSSGNGSHWWFDVGRQAVWPVYFRDGMQPTALSRRITDLSIPYVVMGCEDGYLRRFSKSAKNDDGRQLKSFLAIGPIRTANDDILDGIITEIHGVMAEDSGDVTWNVVVASTADEVCDLIQSGINARLYGGSVPGICASGSWEAGRNMVARCRCRGAWFGLWLESTDRWAFEAVAVVTSQLGRLRYGY